MIPVKPNYKITSQQVQVEWVGGSRKHVTVTLRPGQTIDMALKDDIWGPVQSDRTKALGKTDLVSIISDDGTQLADSAVVVRAEGTRLWFSKPLRLIALESTPLYETKTHEVVPVGTAYALRSKRDGVVDRSVLYNSVEQARAELARREPVRLAG